MTGNDSYGPDYPIMQVWCVGLIAVSLTAMIANILLICVMIHGHMLTSITAKLILHLAIHDIIASFTLLGGGIYACYVINHLGLGVQLMGTLRSCFIITSSILFAVTTESVAVFTVSFDRYLTITKPVQYKTLSTKYQRFMIMLPWSVGVTLTLGLYMFTDDTEIEYCTPARSMTHDGTVLWNLLGTVIAAGVISTLIASYRRVKKLQQSDTSVDPRVKKSLESLILIVAIYVFTYFVGIVVSLVAVLSDATRQKQYYVEIYVSWLLTSNFGSNFFVYVIRAEQYRCNFKNLILGKRSVHCNQIVPANGLRNTNAGGQVN